MDEDTKNRILKELESFVETKDKVDEIYESLLGNKLRNQIGYINQVNINTETLSNIKLDIESLRKENKPYAKYGVIGAVFASAGVIIKSYWEEILNILLKK